MYSTLVACVVHFYLLAAATDRPVPSYETAVRSSMISSAFGCEARRSTPVHERALPNELAHDLSCFDLRQSREELARRGSTFNFFAAVQQCLFTVIFESVNA